MTHKVTPNLIQPTDLREILEDVTTKLVANPKLALPIDKNAMYSHTTNYV